MAGRMKPPGAAAKPKKPPGKGKKGADLAKPGAARKKTAGQNIPDPSDAVGKFEEIFDLHAELNTVSSRIRKKISEAYGSVANDLDTSKKLVKHLFAQEKARRALVKVQRNFDGGDREQLRNLAAILGDTPLGMFALAAAGDAAKDALTGDEDETDPDFDEVDAGEQTGDVEED